MKNQIRYNLGPLRRYWYVQILYNTGHTAPESLDSRIFIRYRMWQYCPMANNTGAILLDTFVPALHITQVLVHVTSSILSQKFCLQNIRKKIHHFISLHWSLTNNCSTALNFCLKACILVQTRHQIWTKNVHYGKSKKFCEWVHDLKVSTLFELPKSTRLSHTELPTFASWNQLFSSTISKISQITRNINEERFSKQESCQISVLRSVDLDASVD